jgi:hypothetical protein
LETTLEKDTIYVNDVDSGKKMDPFLSFGGGDKTYIANGPNILGWGMSAAFGAKLAQPDPASGRSPWRRRVPVRWTAAALEPSALSRADHEHRSQQHELQQRA